MWPRHNDNTPILSRAKMDHSQKHVILDVSYILEPQEAFALALMRRFYLRFYLIAIGTRCNPHSAGRQPRCPLPRPASSALQSDTTSYLNKLIRLAASKTSLHTYMALFVYHSICFPGLGIACTKHFLLTLLSVCFLDRDGAVGASSSAFLLVRYNASIFFFPCFCCWRSDTRVWHE
jgi:hypothetical protein